LTLSTLEAVFSGNRDLFKGLDIEPRLGEARFAPRPVIRLDMSEVATSGGPASFNKNLGDMTAILARVLGVEIPLDTSPGLLLKQLIIGLNDKTGQQVALLIDEYDRPLTDLFQKPDEMEQVRMMLRDYYSHLKSNADLISFLFITGVSKFSRMGLFSGLNDISDLSIDPDYGALCGFTHEELRRNFGPRIEAAAETLNMGQEELLERMRSYYDGFCFDGKTMVYNPFSTLQFLRDKMFFNYWMETGTPYHLNQYMKERRLTVEQFRGVEVDLQFARDPGELDRTPPEGFLYQSGYLSLRPGESPNLFLLDYPNQEVHDSVSRLWVENFLDGPVKAGIRYKALRNVFGSGDAEALIKEFNIFIARLLYDDYEAALQQRFASPVPKTDLQQWFYRTSIYSFLIGAGVDVEGEVHGLLGRTDLVAKTAGKVWVLELKVCREAGADQETAEAAIAQIREKGYARRYGEDAIAVGIAINDTERAITAWRVLGDEPAPGPGAAEKKRTAAKQKKSLKP
jgi:hypothetical protein